MSVLDNSYKGIAGNHTGKTFDKLLEITPIGTAMVSGTAAGSVLLGEGLVDADLVVDVTLSVGANSIAAQFSRTADFAAISMVGPTHIVSAGFTGRMVIPFRNAIGNEQPHGFMRIMPVVGTTLTLGAFVAKK